MTLDTLLNMAVDRLAFDHAGHLRTLSPGPAAVVATRPTGARTHSRTTTEPAGDLNAPERRTEAHR